MWQRNWTVKARDSRRIKTAEMKYMRRTAGYTWADYKKNTQITKKIKVILILDKLLEYKRNWTQNVNRMPRNRLPMVVKHYSATGRRNCGRALKRLLGTWDWNGSISGPTAWHIWWWWWQKRGINHGFHSYSSRYVTCDIKQQHACQLIHIRPIVLQNTCNDTTPDHINRFTVSTNHSNHCSCKIESNS